MLQRVFDIDLERRPNCGGECDLLICYHHPQQTIQLDPERYDILYLGQDRLQPYAAADDKGRPRHTLPGRSHQPVPYLAYSSSAYLSRMADIALGQGRSRPYLRPTCETDLADGLRQLALAGHGVAFLPESSALADVEGGRLVALAGGWNVEMEIRAYRERPNLARPARRRVDRLWQLLESRHTGFCDRPARPLQGTISPRATVAKGRRSHQPRKKEL